MSELDLAKLIREDKIDILVELTGHTANNRLGTMALQPAPIQATWIGYPNSTGLEAIDYRFTDEKCDPLDTQQTHVEELVRLPGCFLCYTPADPDQPPVLPLPALTNGFVTFGSFNNLAKITPEVLRLWARILLAVPNSRLMLKSKPFACETARNHFLGLLQAEGVESWRVDLVPLVAGNTEHLATYSSIDISLDPFPYAGTTTTCESLFMGVPCITLAGDSHAYNVGVSLLAAVGLEKDWVAHDQDEYVELAVKHTSQLARLGVLRSCLRPRMLSSPLCDAPAFMARLEDVYRQLWHRYIQGGREGMLKQRSERSQRNREHLQRRQQQLQQQQVAGKNCDVQQTVQDHQSSPDAMATPKSGFEAGQGSKQQQGEVQGLHSSECAHASHHGGALGGSEQAARGSDAGSMDVGSSSDQQESADGVGGSSAAASKNAGMLPEPHGSSEMNGHEEETIAMAAQCQSLLLDPQPNKQPEDSSIQQQQQQQHGGSAEVRAVEDGDALSAPAKNGQQGSKGATIRGQGMQHGRGKTEGGKQQLSKEQQQGAQQRSKVARQ